MKLTPLNARKASAALRLATSLTIVTLIPLLLHADAPSWWSQRGVLLENATPDDYAPADQGQVKNISRAAAEEMDAKLAGGAGDEIHSILDSWSVTNPRSNEFAPINLGQLKAVAKPFYDRLVLAGVVDTYPWLASLNKSDDFAAANVGQVKNVFSFAIPLPNSLEDPIATRIAASPFAGNLALEPNALWIWNDQLTDADDLRISIPRRVAGLPSVKSVAAGERFLAILGQDGRVWTWGDDADGQLGDGTTINRIVPLPVPSLTSVISVKAGAVHILALLEDGTVLAWGANSYGQLGTGDQTPSLDPKTVPVLRTVHKVAAGYQSSVALKDDGTVWTWGYQRFNNGQAVFNATPAHVGNLDNVSDIAAGYEHIVAVKSDGTVWAWGSNYANQIANGAPWWQYQDVPFLVPNLPSIVKVASAYDHTLAVAADGTVWAWGYNFNGQLGDGTTEPRQTPVQVVGLTDVIGVATAYLYSVAMKSDGTVWAWGDGATGILPGIDHHVPQQVGLGLYDSNHNGMDDRWEMQFFENLDQMADADFDGDGISNRQEYLRRTDPTDYFNGTAPVIEIAGGNNQVGDPGTFLGKPIKVRVRDQAGQILVNAPVSFAISGGFGALATAMNGEQQQSLIIRTDSNGEAAAYHALPNASGTSTRVIASAGDATALASTTFRSIVKFSLPPAPSPSATPPGEPNTSPTATPTPTPTPFAPYRYAIIDLGKDMYPVRINNQGQVLVEGYDTNGDWAHFRWKAGNLERLFYPGPHSELFVKDINDSGVVVGYLHNQTPWRFNAENEIQAGIVWPANSSDANKLSAPAAFPSFEPKPGTIRYASLTAINNANDLYGETGTGTVRGFLNLTITIINARLWPAGTGSSLQLSQATAVNASTNSFNSNWQGSMDSISRANSARHYIGHKFTPFPASAGFLDGTQSGMVDGQSVSFDPVDIDEAGIVVGSAGADMVVRSSPTSQITISSASPLAINDHTYPAPSPQTSAAPTPVAAPQILAWVGNAVAIWERQDDGASWHPFGLEEMIPSMDGWQYLEPYDMNDSGAIVGRAWYTDPSIPGAQGEFHAFLLVPAAMVPDFNRDGKINDDDRDRVTESEPWRWWINDDDDSGDTGGNDIPQNTEHPNFSTSASPDGTDTGTIDGTRDLIDFFPIYLDVRELIRLFPPDGPTGFTYNLKQEGGSTNFVYTDLTSTNAFDYLRKLTGTEANNALALGGTPGTNGAATHHVTSEGARLDPQWLRRISSTSYGVLLVEGRKQDTHPLILEIYGSSGHRFTQVRLPLSLSSVEQMYRHKNLMGADNASGGRPDYATGNDSVHDEPENYPDDLCNNKDFVFVHGYNVNPNDARGWNSEIFKRFYHSGSKGRFIGVTWHGAETQVLGSITTDYQANVDNAFAAAHEFANFLSTLANVTVAAHSLGNVLVGSAIHDWQARPSTYLMIDCAIAQESYDDTEERLTKNDVLGMEHPEWLPYDRRLWSSDWHDRFPANDNRSKLTWKSRLENVDELRTYNFYSTGEEVLRNPKTAPTLPLSANEVWNKQERMKGRMLTGQILSSNYGGWAFSPTWDITEAWGNRQRIPSETAEIPNDELKSNPFFKSGPADLYGASGSDYASPQQHRNTLLAEMIPALSFATGSNPLSLFAPPGGENRNHNMMEYKTIWPRTNPDWQHSDIEVVAYSYVYRLYGKLVELGALNE
jgi:alpha-tubulin suppressor-like RCC1 family protein